MNLISTWDTEEIELMYIGFCAEALETRKAEDGWLFDLVNAVDETWFTCENRKAIHKAMCEIIFESGAKTYIPRNAIAIRAEKNGNEQSNWARQLIAKARDEILIYDPTIYFEKLLPMWKMKLMRSEMKRISSEISISFDKPPTEETIQNAIPSLLEEQQGIWSNAVSFTAKNKDTWQETIDELLSPLPENTSISTGISVLDANIGGGIAQPDSAYTSRLIIVAARPAMGKTSFAVTLAAQLARTGHGVAFFSLEMPKKQIAYKSISCVDFLNLRDTGPIMNPISMNNLQRRSYTVEQRERLQGIKSSGFIKNLEIIDTGQSFLSISNAIRAFVKVRPWTRLIIIDYLQLIRGCGGDANKTESSAIGDVTSGLKSLAKEIKIDIVLLCQVNRGVEGRNDKMPTLADLRASGRIEEDADQVMFLLRPAYYDPEADPGELAISIAKNRHGINGILRCRCHLENSVVFDL